MSRLGELMAQLCPDGVEYKVLKFGFEESALNVIIYCFIGQRLQSSGGEYPFPILFFKLAKVP